MVSSAHRTKEPGEGTPHVTGAVAGELSPVITVDELAALLRVNRKTAYAAIAAGEVPGVRRLGGAIRVHRDAVLAWLAEGQDRISHSRRRP